MSTTKAAHTTTKPTALAMRLASRLYGATINTDRAIEDVAALLDREGVRELVEALEAASLNISSMIPFATHKQVDLLCHIESRLNAAIRRAKEEGNVPSV